MKICCDCVHYKPQDDDIGLCQYPLPFWIRMGSSSRVVSDGDGTECQAFEINVLLYVKELRKKK